MDFHLKDPAVSAMTWQLSCGEWTSLARWKEERELPGFCLWQWAESVGHQAPTTPIKWKYMKRLEVWSLALPQITPLLVRIIQFRRLKGPSKLPSIKNVKNPNHIKNNNKKQKAVCDSRVAIANGLAGLLCALLWTARVSPMTSSPSLFFHF